MIVLPKESNMSNRAVDLFYLGSANWDAYKVKERNGHRIHCELPKILNPMSENPSLVLFPDASPTVTIDEKQNFDPCATTTDVPVNASARTSITSLEDAHDHHHKLSTLRLLAAHIGYINFYLSHLRSWLVQCCFDSIPCNHWCCEKSPNILVHLCLINLS